MITKKYGDGISGPKEFELVDTVRPFDFDDYENESDDDEPMTKESCDIAGRVINQQPVYDKFIDVDVRLSHNDELTRARVTGRTVFDNGQTSGTYHENPYNNTMTYDVTFPDGTVKMYAASLIAENMVDQVDKESFEYNMLASILDYRKTRDALPSDDEGLGNADDKGKDKYIHTTDGWSFHLLWKDENKEWVPLKEVKDSNPIELAEYVRAQRLHEEPAFQWWLPSVLQQREAIVSKVKARAVTTHKYSLDMKNGNSVWRQAIEKEMTNVGITFQLLNHGDDPPIGYTKASGHLIFDVKMDFTRKARFALDGHKTEKPEISTYAGVVSRENIRIVLTYASLNKLLVYAADIQNAYLQAPSSQKHYIECGAELSKKNIGRKALIKRSLYGEKQLEEILEIISEST